MNIRWLLLAVFIASWSLTLFLRRYALAKCVMDIPNERSSHSIPTPRGGGVAIVLTFLLALPILGALNLLDNSALYALFGSGLLVAAIGFADDHGHIAARWRLLGHFMAAAWSLFWVNGLPPIDVFGTAVDFGWLGNILALIYLVWMLNLYNFMDGIDGLASVEAISVCFGMSLVYWFSDSNELIWAPLILSSAVMGFLMWNFPPARIFMGDAGSGFLGIIMAVMALIAAWAKPELFWSWLILLGVFIVDATWTLFRRLVNGEKVHQAHRSHAYQRAALHYKSHLKVTGTVAAINLIWLTPISILVGMSVVSGAAGLSVAYLPLLALVIKWNAGSKDALK